MTEGKIDEINLAAGPSRDHCPHWPAEANGEGHSMSSRSPAGTSMWVRSCDFCGWIDGEDLAEQLSNAHREGFGAGVEWADRDTDKRFAAARAEGYARAVALLRDGDRFVQWAFETKPETGIIADVCADYLEAVDHG